MIQGDLPGYSENGFPLPSISEGSALDLQSLLFLFSIFSTSTSGNTVPQGSARGSVVGKISFLSCIFQQLSSQPGLNKVGWYRNEFGSYLSRELLKNFFYLNTKTLF